MHGVHFSVERISISFFLRKTMAARGLPELYYQGNSKFTLYWCEKLRRRRSIKGSSRVEEGDRRKLTKTCTDLKLFTYPILVGRSYSIHNNLGLISWSVAYVGPQEEVIVTTPRDLKVGLIFMPKYSHFCISKYSRRCR